MPHPAIGGASFSPHTVKAIRLALHGCTNRPFYHIIVMEKKKERDGHCIEQLGTYDPLANVNGEKLCAVNFERLTYWIGEKAIISPSVSKLLGLAGFLPIHPHHYTRGWRERKMARESKEKEQSQQANDDNNEST